MSRSLSLFPSSLKKWAYQLSGFNQYGLLRDDMWNDYDPVVKEALRRCPEHLVDERNFRCIRALQLDFQKRILPKEQWTKLEEDVLYLTPYILEIQKEMREKEEWDAD